MISGVSRKSAPILAVILAGFFISKLVMAQETGFRLSSRDGTVTVPWQHSYQEYDSLYVVSRVNRLSAQYPVVEGQGWVLSGLADGRYGLFLRGRDNSSVNIGTVFVSHYSLHAALGFFCVGLVIFISLIITLYIGNRQGSND